jgi:nitrogen fixation protein FixH
MIRPLTGRGVLAWLLVFFGFIVAVNVTFIVMSVDTFRGEDEQKPYLQGIEYNRTLARRAEQSRLGWTADVSATRQSNGHVRIALALKDRAGAPEAGARLSAELRHPADENRDEALNLVAVGGGRYEADAGPVSAGMWDLMLGSTDAKLPFESTTRLWVP